MNKESLNLNTQIESYDTKMTDKQEKLDQTNAELDRLKKEHEEIENDYRRIRHQKEINKKIEDEWQEKLNVIKSFIIFQKFQMAEERKSMACKFIRNMWVRSKIKPKKRRRNKK